MRGFGAVLRKEGLQMVRDRGTLRFALALPVFQLVLFGLIDTNVTDVPTAVFDQSRSAESRELLAAFQSTGLFAVERYVPSRAALREAIVAGEASVGIEVPPDFARRRLYGGAARVLVLIDGSDSSLSSQALAATNGLTLSRSLEQLAREQGIDELPLEARPQLLFNPDSRSANLLIPGLIAILLTFSGTLLSAYAIVRERERGTLEQLMVTPASPIAVVFGKLLPYLALSFLQLLVVLALMSTVFRVPIHGSVPLLLGLAAVYLFALLSLGLLISARAKTQMEATQIAQMVLLPSIMLSGYIFPLSSLPGPLQWVAQVLPATHFIAISRGIVIRGAGFLDLWQHVAALLAIATVLVLGSARAFRKTVS
ncbi:MAG TPA: ABC transporter permease [Thermoanaerobaculia bacterium]|nr:ABC transporter permease [Thermoanaerobaculia bacterium]